MWQLARYSYNTHSWPGHHPVFWIFYPIIIIIAVVVNWRIFEKAGEAGWKAIIPLYNTYTLLKIVDLSGWYLLLFFVPIVNIIFWLYVLNRLANGFGYGFGMALLSIIIIGLFILAFGDAKFDPKRI